MRSLQFCFLLVLAVSVYSETCPAAEDILPCYCSGSSDSVSLVCEANTSLEELERALGAYKGKKNVALVIGGMEIRNAPMNLFEGIGVEQIQMHSFEVEILAGDENKPIFSGLENTLERLWIENSFMEEYFNAKISFSHLRKLDTLYWNYNGIIELGDEWFANGPDSLTDLRLSHNGIREVGDRAFADLTNVRFLSFDGNLIGSVKRSMFPSSAAKLTSLNLGDNRLSSLPEDIFSGMSNLEYFSIHRNYITRLEQATWERIWDQLKAVDTEGNPLECDSHMSWMFEKRGPEDIRGTCASPAGQKGKSLDTFIKNRGL